MSKVKVLIEVDSGLVLTVCATQDIDILIVDYDPIDKGKAPVIDRILGPDAIFESGKAHELFSDNNPAEVEVREAIKNLKY